MCNTAWCLRFWRRVWFHINLRGQLSQICDVYMHLVKLTFWQHSKLQSVLINSTFLCKLTSSDMLYHDFRNCLVLFKPCISQCTGFNRH